MCTNGMKFNTLEIPSPSWLDIKSGVIILDHFGALWIRTLHLPHVIRNKLLTANQPNLVTKTVLSPLFWRQWLTFLFEKFPHSAMAFLFFVISSRPDALGALPFPFPSLPSSFRSSCVGFGPYLIIMCYWRCEINFYGYVGVGGCSYHYTSKIGQNRSVLDDFAIFETRKIFFDFLGSFIGS